MWPEVKGSKVRGYWVCVSGSPTLLSRTELSTRSSRQVATKRSGGESVRKLFPKDAAWWREEHTAALWQHEGEEEEEEEGRASHPQQGLLGDGVVLVTRRFHALGHRLSQHALLLDFPQVLIGLLAGLLQGGRGRDHGRPSDRSEDQLSEVGQR